MRSTLLVTVASLREYSLNNSFFSTLLFSKTIVEQISTINAIRMFRNSLCYERISRIIEIISTFCLNSMNVEFLQAIIKKVKRKTCPCETLGTVLEILEIVDFLSCEFAVGAFFKAGQLYVADGDAGEFLDGAAHCLEHFADLSVLAFVDGNCGNG